VFCVFGAVVRPSYLEPNRVWGLGWGCWLSLAGVFG